VNVPAAAMAANHVNHVEGALLAGAAKPHIQITKARKVGDRHRPFLLRTHSMALAIRTSGYAGRRSADSSADLIQRLTDTLKIWKSRIASRRELMELDAHMLRDIGLSDLEAHTEASKPFWRA
jgi:uncharacterized protein YjiS (DUF1127 family)